jgi:phosphotransferase system IIA component
MGIGTVDLNGHGFKSFIKQHQKIRVGDVLAIMDLPYILQHNKITDIVFVALSKENIDSIELKESAPVAINDEIAKITIK